MRVRCMASFSWMRVRAAFHFAMVVEGEARNTLRANWAVLDNWRRVSRRVALFPIAMATVGTMPTAAPPSGADAYAWKRDEDVGMDDALALVDERMLDRDESVDPMALLAYYRRLLPFRSLYTWLNHDAVTTRNFTNREFAFTLQNDAYLRYQSFASWDEWKKEVCRLNPSRFEIGPVYSAKVCAEEKHC